MEPLHAGAGAAAGERADLGDRPAGSYSVRHPSSQTFSTDCGLITMMNSARTHAAELRPHLEQLGVAGFLTEVAPLLEPHATARHVLFAIERAPAELRVSADPARLRQVLINVVSSAAMLAGPGGTVRIWCESNDSLVAVRVRETARDHHAAARREHGSGFALSVSRELARAMGGDLKVLHHPERCSTFTLELRRVR